MDGNYEVQYNGIDGDYLLHQKTLHFGDFNVNTPFASQALDQWTGSDTPLNSVRGFNEVYRQVSIDYLTSDRDLDGEIARTLDRADDDSVSCLFFSIPSERPVDPELLRELAKLQAKHSAYYAVPFRPKIVDAINSKDREVNIEEYFGYYESTVSDYLNIVSDLDPEKPVMGAIPALRWGMIRKLIQRYIERDIAAMCVNFNGRSPLVSPAQVDNILVPLQSEIGFHNWQFDGFLYAINAHRGQRAAAADFLALAAGFDAIGGYHTSPSGDKEFFDNIPDVTPLRVFRRHSYTYDEIPVGEVANRFPKETNLDPDRAQRFAENGNAGGIRKVLTAEQMGLAANTLRQEIRTGNAGQFIQSKLVGDGRELDALQAIRSEFDSDSKQEGLAGD